MLINIKPPITKKTILLSKVDTIISELKRRRKEHEVRVLDKVKGCGINDIDDEYHYLIRRLKFDNYIILEQYIKIKDTDLDDFIISKVFLADKEPKNWKAVVCK